MKSVTNKGKMRERSNAFYFIIIMAIILLFLFFLVLVYKPTLLMDVERPILPPTVAKMAEEVVLNPQMEDGMRRPRGSSFNSMRDHIERVREFREAQQCPSGLPTWDEFVSLTNQSSYPGEESSSDD
jgi:hypothetical protein